MIHETHVSDEELAAYIDDSLNAEERAGFEAHLAECEPCRVTLVAARRALATGVERPQATGRTLRRLTSVASLAAAAVLLFFIVPRARRGPSTDSDARTRGGSALVGDNTPRIAAQSPAPDAVVRLDTVEFRWIALSGGASYQLTISDVAGGIVWTTQTTAAAVVLPGNVAARLTPGSTYYWRVDALLPDLRSTTTDPRAFIPATR